MELIKILVVEDEVIIADTIVDAITDFGYKALEPAITYSEAIETIEKEMPDIGVFDIQLSGKKTGIDLAEFVLEKYKFPYIFLTSNSDKATLEQAKLVEPSAFLVKPFNNDELFAAIEIALFNYSKQKTREVNSLNNLLKNVLFIKKNEHYKRVNIGDIIYLKSDNVYVDIHTKQGEVHTVRARLGDYLKKLDGNFLRIHRGYIINLNFLDIIKPFSVLILDQEIPIGISYKKELFREVKKSN